MFFMIFLVVNQVLSNELHGPPTEEWLQNHYERHVRPNASGAPVDIETNFHVNNIGKISEISMTYDIDIYLRESWQDLRLAQSDSHNETVRYILHESLSDYLWIPDTFLPQAVMHEETQTNPKSVTHKTLIRLWSNGYILMSRRFTLTVHCPMDLTLYPFDRQVCRLSIESYGLESNQMIYHWKKNEPVTTNPEMELPDFKLTEIITKRRNMKLSTGTYSRLECCFVLERRAGFYFMVLFFPATGIVIISWVSLAMSKDNTFSDIIQVILAIIFLNFSHNAVMPKVSYIKAIDVFIQACFLFVFLSLIKIGIEKHLEETKRINNLDVNHTVNDKVPEYSTIRNFYYNISTLVETKCHFCHKYSLKIMKYLFPILFFIFFVVYFVAYYTISLRKNNIKCNFI